MSKSTFRRSLIVSVVIISLLLSLVPTAMAASSESPEETTAPGYFSVSFYGTPFTRRKQNENDEEYEDVTVSGAPEGAYSLDSTNNNDMKNLEAILESLATGVLEAKKEYSYNKNKNYYWKNAYQVNTDNQLRLHFIQHRM